MALTRPRPEVDRPGDHHSAFAAAMVGHRRRPGGGRIEPCCPPPDRATRARTFHNSRPQIRSHIANTDPATGKPHHTFQLHQRQSTHPAPKATSRWVRMMGRCLHSDRRCPVLALLTSAREETNTDNILDYDRLYSLVPSARTGRSSRPILVALTSTPTR